MLRRWFADMSTFVAIAAALFVLGSGFVLADLQSPSLLQWTGSEVPNVQSGGIAYYSFQGVEYTMNVPSRAAAAGPMPSTVYLDPADPSHATFSRPVTKWVEALVVVGPYATSVLVLAFGFARRSRLSHKSATVKA